jgi:hypothetical protein
MKSRSCSGGNFKTSSFNSSRVMQMVIIVWHLHILLQLATTCTIHETQNSRGGTLSGFRHIRSPTLGRLASSPTQGWRAQSRWDCRTLKRYSSRVRGNTKQSYCQCIRWSVAVRAQPLSTSQQFHSFRSQLRWSEEQRLDRCDAEHRKDNRRH